MSDAEQELASRFAQLAVSVRGQGNQVHIVLRAPAPSGRGVGDASATPSRHAGVGDASATPSRHAGRIAQPLSEARDDLAGRADAEPVAQPPAEGGSQKIAQKRYYVITHCPRDPTMVGIWHATWAALEQRLPGQRLFGSSARPCKKCDSLDSAKAHWKNISGPEISVRELDQAT